MQLYHINLCEAAYFKNTGLSEGLIFYMLILFQLLLQKCHTEKSDDYFNFILYIFLVPYRSYVNFCI